MLRLGTHIDPLFLIEMLYEAVHWEDSGEEERPPLEALLTDPVVTRYVDGWGRDGDLVVVAIDRGDAPVGAAWCRRFPADAPGYGFVAEAVPELSIALYPEIRGRGVGSLLVGTLLARAQAAGNTAMSLSVAATNPARHLYARFGFEVVADHDGTLTMRADLA